MRRKRKRRLAAAGPRLAAAAGVIATAGGLMKLRKKLQVRQVQKKVDRKTNAPEGPDPQIDKSQ